MNEMISEDKKENSKFQQAQIELRHLHETIALLRNQLENQQFEKDTAFPKKANLDLLTDPAELALVKMLVSWPKLVESAAIAHEPHRIAFYLVDLASSFHSLWNAGRKNPALRFILEQDGTITAARMQLIKATSLVICAGLNVLSIKALEEM